LAHHPKDGFVDRLHSLRFLRECDPSYRVLTLALVGLPPTEYASLKLDTHRKPDFTGGSRITSGLAVIRPELMFSALSERRNMELLPGVVAWDGEANFGTAKPVACPLCCVLAAV